MQEKRTKAPVRVIGVTGGVGSGKSRILELLSTEFGARVILADQVAKELEEPGQAGLSRLLEAFGDGILGPDGTLDRGRFAERIFHDPVALRTVNEIIHPLTWQEIRRQIWESGESLIAVESALFDETTKEICQELWLVDASEKIRIRRLMDSRGYSREKCEKIIRSQKSRGDFIKLADVVIENNGSIEEVRAQIAARLQESKKTDDKGTAV